MRKLSDEALTDMTTDGQASSYDAQSIASELLASRKAIAVMRDGLEFIEQQPGQTVMSLTLKAEAHLSQADKILRGDG